MSPVWQAAVVLAVVVTWLTTPPVSLADAARREALRRVLVGPATATLTTHELPAAAPSAAVTGLPPAPPPKPAAVESPGEPAEPKRDETWWRARMNAAKAALERDQVLADALQSRINALQADVVNIDDPAQQALARQNLGRALGEFDRLQKQVEADREEIDRIQEEARRQRVPPGWIR